MPKRRRCSTRLYPVKVIDFASRLMGVVLLAEQIVRQWPWR